MELKIRDLELKESYLESEILEIRDKERVIEEIDFFEKNCVIFRFLNSLDIGSVG